MTYSETSTFPLSNHYNLKSFEREMCEIWHDLLFRLLCRNTSQNVWREKTGSASNFSDLKQM